MSVKENNRGTTMIEVLVAIVVVLLVTASFSKLLSVSVRMFSNSIKIMKETQDFNERYYTNEAIGQRQDIQEELSLCVDTTRTDAANMAGSSVKLALNTDCSMVCWLAPSTAPSSGYKMYSVGEAQYLIAAATEAPPTPSEAPTEAPSVTEIPTPTPEPTETPTETPTEPAATEAPTLPGTDILLVDSYWPVLEDYLAKYIESNLQYDPTVDVEPGGIFQWGDDYYIVVQTASVPYSFSTLGPDEFLKSEQWRNRLVVKIQFPILTEADFPSNKKNDLKPGDICKIIDNSGNTHWYIWRDSYNSSENIPNPDDPNWSVSDKWYEIIME